MDKGTLGKELEIIPGSTSGGQLSFVLLARILLGIVFLLASIDKIINPAAFAQNIYAYQILPDTWINILAITLPWLEAILGCLLLAGLWLPGAVSLVNLLLVIFLGALVFNMARGLDVDCGCFSTGAKGGGAMWTYLFRDLIFLIISGYLFFQVVMDPPQSRPADARQKEAGTPCAAEPCSTEPKHP